MEKHIKIIDLINGYRNNMLSKTENLAFENRLETDAEFNEIYNEHLTFLEGLERLEVTNEIQAARQDHVRVKWIKYIGLSTGVILVSIVVYSLFSKTNDVQVTEPMITESIVVSDSITVEKPSEKSVIIQDSTETEGEKSIVSEENKTITTVKEEIVKSEPIKTKNQATVYKVDEVVLVKEKLSLELIDFYKSVKKAPQIIEVNTEKDFTVTCKEGTVLTISAKSFIDADTGALARGTINLEVTEYYKLSDMLLANLSTKSDDEILETGGMLYLDANRRGAKLKLKPGRRIQMAFNNKGKKDMQLFHGEEQNDRVNWRLENNAVAVSSRIKSEAIVEIQRHEEEVEVSFVFIEEPPIYPGCEAGDSETIKKCLADRISGFLSKNFDASISKDLGLTGVQKINIFLKIEKDGTIGEIKASAQRKEFGDEAIRVIESLPQLKPGKHRGKAVSTTFYLPFIVTLEGKTTSDAPITVRSDKKFIQEMENRMDSTRSIRGTLPVSNSDIERYGFSTTKLGWINCDRFSRTTSEKLKYKFTLKDAEGANVKMVFKSMSSILPSSKRNDDYDFSWVPKGEEVVLIAIKWKDNKLYLGKKETKTEAISELELDFKEVTLQELKEEIEILNDSF